ncbi:MAG: hypothetical protein MHMPM18_000918 [Marteilia pararefringens]
MSIFYNILDTAAYNAFLLYIDQNPQFKSRHGKQSRREFLKLLAEELLDEESVEKELPKKMKISNDRGNCQSCNSKKRTRIKCERCAKFVCEEHRIDIKICNSCKYV